MTAPAMILMRTPTWAKVMLALLLGAFLMFGFSCYGDHNREVEAALAHTADSLQIVVNAKEDALRVANARVDTVTKDRVLYTDRILSGDRPSIPRGEVVDLANKCTEVEKSCAEQKKAAAALIDNLKASLAVEQKRVAWTPPRFNFAIEGGYNFTQHEIPVRGRAELRIAGPISLIGEAQLRVSPDSVRLPDLTAFVHYSFK